LFLAGSWGVLNPPPPPPPPPTAPAEGLYFWAVRYSAAFGLPDPYAEEPGPAMIRG
jgi:hypothetical protein